MKRRMRLLLTTVVILAGLAFGSTGCSSGSSQNELTPTPIPTRIVPARPTYQVQRGEIIMQLRFTGRIAPVLEQEIFFQTSGRVRNVYVSRYDSLTAGQVLADLEQLNALEQRAAMDQLSLQRAQVYVDIAQLNLDMYKQQASPDSPEYDYQLAIKEHEVELANIALQEATLNSQDLEIAIAAAQATAPFDGQVLSLGLAEGRTAEAFNPVAVIADLNDLEVAADLTDAQLEFLSEGMPVTIEPQSSPGEILTGHVRQLPYPYGGGSSDGGGESTRISLDVPAAEAGIKLGNLVRVTVLLERKENVLWLPPQVIRTFEGREFVVAQDGEFQSRVDVNLGIRSEDRVEIIDGLSEGQVVVGP